MTSVAEIAPPPYKRTNTTFGRGNVEGDVPAKDKQRLLSGLMKRANIIASKIRIIADSCVFRLEIIGRQCVIKKVSR